MFQLLADIENDYDCGGFCTTPLFAITTPVASGPPTTECMDKIIQKTFGAAGAVSVVGAIFLFITLFMSLALCGGKPTSAGDEEVEGNKA